MPKNFNCRKQWHSLRISSKKIWILYLKFSCVIKFLSEMKVSTLSSWGISPRSIFVSKLHYYTEISSFDIAPICWVSTQYSRLNFCSQASNKVFERDFGIPQYLDAVFSFRFWSRVHSFLHSSGVCDHFTFSSWFPANEFGDWTVGSFPQWKVLRMMLHSSLPIAFWWLAVNCAVHILNRIVLQNLLSSKTEATGHMISPLNLIE